MATFFLNFIYFTKIVKFTAYFYYYYIYLTNFQIFCQLLFFLLAASLFSFFLFFFSFLTSTNETVCGFNGFDDFDVLTGWNFYYYIFPFLCSVLCWHMNEYNFPSQYCWDFFCCILCWKERMDIFERESQFKREFKDNWRNYWWKWKVQIDKWKNFLQLKSIFAKFPPLKWT